ncbi:MAG: hypothetical protein K5697_15310 [Lachnospiraceae bacterium]|nr:hypothetical protein [Lachnospiraceae bacterium]
MKTPISEAYDKLVLDTDETDLSNIKRYITGTSGLPRVLAAELEKQRDSLEDILKRLFWLLQYYMVYYFRRNENITSLVLKNSISEQYGYREYYSFSPQYSRLLYEKLCENCKSFSSTLSHMVSEKQLNFLSLSRIILEVLISHYDYYTKRFSIPDAVPALKTVIPNEEQFMIYETRINCFSRNSFDRFNVLQEWADRNYYAAAELGDIYLHGINQHISIGCEKEIKRSYQKAANYYTRSIALSSPPYPYACWSYADMLRDKYNEGIDAGDISILETGLEYLHKAGMYPPALNLLADYEIKIAAYRKKHGLASKKELAALYRQSLIHAKQAAENGWYYANSRIALFIREHKKDTELMSFLGSVPELVSFLNEEKMLKIATDHNNLWALKALAEYYIGCEKLSEAEGLLKKACELGYNAAFYTMAMKVCPTEESRMEYLLTASEMSYPHASYELAVIYRKRKNYTKALEYICRADQQMNCWFRKDFDMAGRILRLKEALENDF